MAEGLAQVDATLLHVVFGLARSHDHLDEITLFQARKLLRGAGREARAGASSASIISASRAVGAAVRRARCAPTAHTPRAAPRARSATDLPELLLRELARRALGER